MADLQRITTEYIEAQDRLRLAGELADGAPQVLWLTQRLLQRLLPVLLQQLQGAGAGAETDTPYADLLHSFVQQSARAELVPQPPVQASDSSPAWLVVSVDIVQSAEGVRLTFKGAQDQQVSLALVTLALRQWLGIVHDAYAKAEWPLQGWPQWLQEGSESSAVQAVVLH